jgi:hypothetical protein
VLFSFRTQAIENDAGLNPGDSPRGIDFEDGRHVLRKVEDDGGIATLSSE